MKRILPLVVQGGFVEYILKGFSKRRYIKSQEVVLVEVLPYFPQVGYPFRSLDPACAVPMKRESRQYRQPTCSRAPPGML